MAANGQALQFEDRAVKVVRDFIRTVLVIDDDWPGREETFELPSSPAPADALESPADVVEDAPEAFAEAALLSSRPNGELNGREERQRLLSIEKMVTASGALFSGLRYRGSLNELRQLTGPLACRADVVILDWHLVGESSDDALHILRSLRDDGGLHFVCIYTGQGRPSDVKNAIAADLGNMATGSDTDFRIENLVVAIRNKPSMGEGQVVEPENLFDVAVRSIAQTYRGLVQLGLLEITNRHRDQLPRMLTAYGPEFDAAFVYEATNETSPVRPGGPFLMLVLDEWRSLLEASMADRPMCVLSDEGIESFSGQRVGKAAQLSMPALHAHLSAAVGKTLSDKHASRQPSIIGAIADWSKETFRSDPPGGWSRDEKMAARWGLLRAIFDDPTGTEVDAENVFLPLMRLESMFQQQCDLPRRIALGTVLRSEGAEYLVCITPACDAARPEKIDNVFSFLVGERVTIGQSQKAKHEGFGYVVKEKDTFVAVNARVKPIVTLRVPEPELGTGGEVLAYVSFPLKTAAGPTGSIKLTVVAQLRVDHALALAQLATSEASRVGLDRGEFIRTRFTK